MSKIILNDKQDYIEMIKWLVSVDRTFSTSSKKIRGEESFIIIVDPPGLEITGTIEEFKINIDPEIILKDRTTSETIIYIGELELSIEELKEVLARKDELIGCLKEHMENINSDIKYFGDGEE